jgi:hypothetical protein
MGYFRANERYLNGGAGEPEVAAPWGVQAQEGGLAGQWQVTWRPPYTPVDSYGVYGQAATDPAGAWQELLRVAGTAHAAAVQLGPGGWRLAVVARCGPTDSPRVIAECGVRRADWVQGTVAEEAQAHANLPAAPQPPPAAMLVPPNDPHPHSALGTLQSPTPICPDCGARVADRADGSSACVYCGCGVAITPDGRALALDRLLYGACTCCVPRHPLIRQGDALVCPAQPGHRYGVPLGLGDGRHDGDQPNPAPRPQPPTPVAEPTPELDWTAIDTALRENSARLGRHGLFVRDRG